MITNEELTKAILELREAQAQTDEQMKETGEYIKALFKNIDGVNKSIGLEVEEFFYSSLKKNPTISLFNAVLSGDNHPTKINTIWTS